MRKYIILLITVLLVGCNSVIDTTPKSVMIITHSRIYKLMPGMCSYGVSVYEDKTFNAYFRVIDSCHCWSVGDSLTIVKKYRGGK